MYRYLQQIIWPWLMGDHCERVQLQVEGGCTTRVGQCLGLLGAGAGLGSCAAPPFRATRSIIQQIQLYHLSLPCRSVAPSSPLPALSSKMAHNLQGPVAPWLPRPHSVLL